MNDVNIRSLLIQLLKKMNYTDKLADDALDDLEKIIAVRYYNQLVSLLPDTLIVNKDELGYKQIMEKCGSYFNEKELQDMLEATVKGVLTEYFEAIAEM